MWFKEYVFNIIIQPFHLILYTIMVGSAMSLASVSLPYAVVAIYFLIPAEKLLRKFFGFDNAGTLSAAGSFAGGALFSAMINKINRPKPPHEKDEDDKPKTRKPSKNGLVNSEQLLFGGAGGGTGSGAGAGAGSGAGAGAGSGAGAGAGTGAGAGAGSGAGSGTGAGAGAGSGAGAGGGSFKPTIGLRDSAITLRDEDDKNKIISKTKWGLAHYNRGIMNRLGSVATAGYYNTRNKLKRGLKAAPKTAGRMVRRGVIGGVTGGTAALLALGAGAATGDPSKALGLMTAAGAAGYNFGNYYGDKAAKGVAGAANAARTAFWGDNLKNINQYNFDKEFMSSPETISKLTQALGSTSKAKEAISDGSVQALLNNNITDPGKVAKALALRDKYINGKAGDKKKYSPEEALEKAIVMAKYNRDLNPGVLNPMSRERTSFEQNLAKRQIQQADIDAILKDLEYFET